MSFGVNIIGSPEAIKEELAATSARLTEQSKAEFDSLWPALVACIDQNTNGGDEGAGVVLHVEAYGHANFVDGAKVYGDARMHVRRVDALVVS